MNNQFTKVKKLYIFYNHTKLNKGEYNKTVDG